MLRKISIIVMINCLLVGCVSTTFSIKDKYYSNYKLTDKKILIDINIPNKKFTYNVVVVPLSVNMALLMGKYLKEELEYNKQKAYLYKRMGLAEIDNKRLGELKLRKKIDVILQVNQIKRKTEDGLTVSGKFEVLVITIKGKKMWSAVVDVERKGFGSGGLNEDSAEEFSWKVVDKLIEYKFLNRVEN